MQSFLSWSSDTPSDAIRKIFFAEGSEPRAGLSRPRLANGQLAIGYSSRDGNRPSVVLVGERDSVEVLAWIATYAPEAFPLTQTIRVMGVDEYELCETYRSLEGVPRHGLVWSSIIFGEMLSQGQGWTAVDRVPISRALGCFSFAVARSNFLYSGSRKINGNILGRLQAMERDPLFSKRVLNVRHLEQIWSFADGFDVPEPELRRVIEVVMAAIDPLPRTRWLDIPFLSTLEIDISKLSSGPIEQRVQEFEKATRSLLRKASENESYSQHAAMYLAAFTFWVGSGTTHISLLDDFSPNFPAVYAWMGLFAGLAGPTTWDSKWLRGVTAVERLVRAPFSLEDPPSADLSWVEYELIAAQKYPVEWVKEIPKLSVRALTVELIAGASCQMRLADDDSEPDSESTRTAAAKKASIPRGTFHPEDREQLRFVQDVLNYLLSGSNESQRYQQDGLFPVGALTTLSSPQGVKKRVVQKRSK